MKRKLIRQGYGGITISLPIKWVRSRNLEAGDEVTLEEQDTQLVIGGASHGKKSKKLYFKEITPQLLRTIISSYYRQGYTELELEFEEPQPFSIVHAVVDSLIGYEVITQDKNSCIIKDIMGNKQEDATPLINKLMQNVNLLFEVTDEADIEEIERVRTNIFRLRDYCQRSVALARTELSYELYAFILAIEKVASHYRKLKAHKKDAQLCDEYFRKLHTCFLKKNFEGANRIYLDIRTELQAFEAKPKNSAHITHILYLLLTMASRLQIIAATD